jgi:hypothetical protein
MKKLVDLYLGIPGIFRKYIRDFVVIFMSFVSVSGVLDQDTPDFSLLWKVIIASLGMTIWRVARIFVERNSGSPGG